MKVRSEKGMGLSEVEERGKVKADGVRRHRRLWPPPSPMAAAWGRGTKKKKAEGVGGFSGEREEGVDFY